VVIFLNDLTVGRLKFNLGALDSIYMSDTRGLLDEHDLESFRQSGVYEIFPLLRKGILHRTNPKSYWGIKESGFIIPNQGQFPYTYPQSKVYYAHSKGYVCLFDFESVSEEECIFIYHTWGGFFSDQKPFTVVVRLNREILADELIPNSAGPKSGQEDYKSYIPFIEVWYPKPVPISAIDGYMITFWDSEAFQTRCIEYSKKQVEEFEVMLVMLEEEVRKLQEANKE